MKISETWLREWINPPLTRDALCNVLTMSGLEIEEADPVAEKFSHVVIGQVLRIEKHPEADRLKICEVDVGGKENLTIVCGAKNVTEGMRVAAALDGAMLSNKTKITTTKLRGVTSQGMLCSARELGLAEESEGLYALPANAPLGMEVWEFLKLADYIIDISITPNRGDCLSILGLTHEISALTSTKPTIPTISTVPATLKDSLAIDIAVPKNCPRYVGRIIRNVTTDANTPIWMQERLRRSGIRCISPVVDVMNYVMLELGQPMHAFDLAKINGNIKVRMAKKDETLELLDGQTITLDSQNLVIADQDKALAVAGVMGGLDSGVSLLTKDIFLESAFFTPATVAHTVRQFNLGSESSYRFERGIDPLLQAQAIERATLLIIEIAGGEPGPVIDVVDKKELPAEKNIELRTDRIERLLGITISEHEVVNILSRLGFQSEKSTQHGFKVTVPARRFDVTEEIDLIEEIVRLYGYDKIPLHLPVTNLQISPRVETKLYLPTIRDLFCHLGYREVITYSFVDEKLQRLLDPDRSAKKLVNPITSEMTVMRTSLWPGLITTLLYNLNRQQSDVRLFETGLGFITEKDQLIQQNLFSGLMTGDVFPQQWGNPSRAVDFFDLKGDLESLFKLSFAASEFMFKTTNHPALHPGQSAAIYRNNQYLGIIGALHPSIAQTLDITKPVYLFEMLLAPLEAAAVPHSKEISKFPEIRRDLAILVDCTIPAQLIQDTITEIAGELLQDVSIFDVYQGKGVAPDRKSVALSLALQHHSRTLVDEEVAELMQKIISALNKRFAAELRG